jgi:hypothetical protein
MKKVLSGIIQFIFGNWIDKDGDFKYWKLTCYLVILISFGLNVHFDQYIIEVKDHNIKMEDYRVAAYDLYDGEVKTFEIKDAYHYGIFDSSDMFNRINNGSRYYIRTAGYRIPIFSMFPKIISMVEIKSQVPVTPVTQPAGETP